MANWALLSCATLSGPARIAVPSDLALRNTDLDCSPSPPPPKHILTRERFITHSSDPICDYSEVRPIVFNDADPYSEDCSARYLYKDSSEDSHKMLPSPLGNLGRGGSTSSLPLLRDRLEMVAILSSLLPKEEVVQQ